MASGVETPQVPSENPINSSPESIHVFDPAMLIDEDYDSDYLPGSRLADEQQFRNRRGGEVKLTPLLIDLRRLLSSKSERSVIKGVSNRDLLHAVVGLFNTSLSEMTPEVLYATVCEKWARTMILVRDVPSTLSELERRKAKKLIQASNKSEDEDEDEKKAVDEDKPPDPGDVSVKNGVQEEKDTGDEKSAGDGNEVKVLTEDEDVLEEEAPRPGKFDCLFSDTEEEESDEDDDEEDFSKGINSFLESAKKRRTDRLAHEGLLGPEHIGIENRIFGAATFKKTYCKGERLIHLTVIAVRKRYRKFGVGKFLISQVKDTNVVGQYDAVVVHADNGAIEFFERYGFTPDIVINSKWSDLAEQFTNCTLMSYLPPFTGQTLLSQSVPELDIIAMEKEIKKWQEKTVEAYKAENVCINRLRHEIIHLRALSSSQAEIINSLMEDNDRLRREKFLTEKEYMNYRLATAKTAFSEECLADDEDDDELSAEILIQQLRNQVRQASSSVNRLNSESSDEEVPAQDTSNHYLLSAGSNGEPYCHGQDTQEFYQHSCAFLEAIKKDPSIVTNYSVKAMSKAVLTSKAEEAITKYGKELEEDSISMSLYFCGSIEHASRLEEILREGFTEEDFIYGDYGIGLYFSKFPSKATKFSALGKLLLAEVNLGHVESVVRKDSSRTGPAKGYHAILTPGRLSVACSGDNERQLFQEYVIFNPLQARPLVLIEYSASG